MIHRREFHAMGCKILALVDTDPPPSDLENIPIWFEEWEQVLSRFRSDSELCRLNQGLFLGPQVQVSQILWDVFQASMEAEKLTGGLINPLIYDALISAGYDKSFELLSIESKGFSSEFESTIPSINEVITDSSARFITLPMNAHLDFGGIAKGWAAHQATERLSAYGPALVSAGGDVEVKGPLTDGEFWSIGIEDPFNQGSYIKTVYLDSGGIATSGKDYRFWMKNGKSHHHIIDPKTGLPADTDILTATVIAPNVMQAEAMAKAVMISGSQAGLSWLDSDQSLSGLLILENGQLLESENFSKFV